MLSALRTSRTSETVVIIGSRMRTGPWALARRMAASWASNSLRWVSEKRIARRPSAGLAESSRVSPSADISFSPPTSSVRMVTARPSIASTMFLSASYCSSSSGRSCPTVRPAWNACPRVGENRTVTSSDPS